MGPSMEIINGRRIFYGARIDTHEMMVHQEMIDTLQASINRIEFNKQMQTKPDK
jgi:hypothetical protein